MLQVFLGRLPPLSVLVFLCVQEGLFPTPLLYRGLNNIAVKNTYPLPFINSAFEHLQGATIYSKLDTFNPPLGRIEYLSTILVQCTSCFRGPSHFVNIDQMQVFTRNMEEHIINVRQVLQTLGEQAVCQGRVVGLRWHSWDTSLPGGQTLIGRRLNL